MGDDDEERDESRLPAKTAEENARRITGKVGYGAFISIGVAFGIFTAGQAVVLIQYAVYADRVAQTEIARNDLFVQKIADIEKRVVELDRERARLAVVEDRQINSIAAQSEMSRRIQILERQSVVPTP